jgi:hypothetical protein
VALSSSARASLRYRITRALLMASRIPTQQNEDSSTGKKKRCGSGPLAGVTEAAKGSRGSDPRLLGLTMGGLLDRTFGVRPRASRIVHALGLDQLSIQFIVTADA